MNEESKVTAQPELGGRVCRLVLDAPPGNVLDFRMVRALRGQLSAAAEAQVIVLEGAGAHFSYGASIQDHLPEAIGPFLREFHGLFRDLLECHRPLVAVVRGQCLGGGLELAAFCQRIVAAPDAQLGQPEIRLAVFAPLGSLLLPRRIGQVHADDLLLSGRTVTASRALEIGLVQEIADDPRGAALSGIERDWLSHSRSSLSFAVQAARTGLHADLTTHLDRVERLYLDELMHTPDAVEGVQAFLEKRPPRYAE